MHRQTTFVSLYLSEDGELDRQFVMTLRHVSHVLVFQCILVVNEHPGVAREPISAVVVYVEFLVVETVVGLRTAPRRERPNVGLRPRLVWVVDSQSRYSGTIQIERIECVAVEF